MMKLCSKCNVEKDETEFAFKYTRKDGSRSRLNVCAPCMREHDRVRNAAPGRTQWRRDRNLKLNYGFATDTFDSMLAKQGGRCANQGCRTDEPGGRGKKFHVDHDHETGQVRALLCNTCNVSLGHLGDCYANDRIYGLYEYAVEHGPKLIGGPGALFELRPTQERQVA